jgi:hypothetical protein
MIKNLILFLSFIILTTPCYSTNWYVNPDCASSCDGTTWAKGWAALADVQWGSGKVNASDTLYLSGDVVSRTYTAGTLSYPTAMLNVGAQGTDDTHRITIATGAKDTSTGYASHGGKVIFDLNGQWGAIQAGNLSYITIDGEKNGTRNWEITNGVKDCDSLGGVVFFSNGSMHTGTRIRYLEIHEIGQGLQVRSGRDTEISYCKIYRVLGNHAINAVGGTDLGVLSNTRIHHNELENNWQGYASGGSDSIEGSYGLDIYNNIFTYALQVDHYPDCQHPDTIQTNGPQTRIWNNIFRGCGYACWSTNRSVPDGSVEDFWLVNNVFISPDSNATIEGGIIADGDTVAGRIYIVGNTFVDSLESQVFRLVIPASVTTLSDVRFQNNIIFNSHTSGGSAGYIRDYRDAACGDLTIDHNVIGAGASGSSAFVCSNANNDPVYSVASGTVTSSTFTSYTERSFSSNLSLSTTDTVAKNNGIDLSALGSVFTTDILGNARSGAWDIGAYKYVGGSPPTVPCPNGTSCIMWMR